ncbi:MAG: REP-associated tyrosine transposase [Bryobacteraceae bacterium]
MDRRRRLPHIYPEGKLLFITWHLHGSLPNNLYPPPTRQNAGQAFFWMDRYLDSAREGPLYLKQEPVAQLVVRSIRHCAEQLHYYDLHAYVVMANHVHLLVEPRINPSRFLQTVKGYTAREANRLLGRTGQPFWQPESYDHWVRDEREAGRIKDYIENNPVQAGLVARAEDYQWSSAGRKAEMTLGSAGLEACATTFGR